MPNGNTTNDDMAYAKIYVPDRMLSLKVLKLNKNISEVEYGTRWLKEKKSLMLKVQSAVLPYEYEHEFNLIINPLHPDFHKIFVAEVHSFSFDKRFD